MKLHILSGAQTGVDMGAALEALACGVPLGGFMPADACNEDGPIPEHVALHLLRHNRINPAARTRANVAMSDAALVVVQDRRRAGATRGTALTIQLCQEQIPRKSGGAPFSMLVVDPNWLELGVATWAAGAIDRMTPYLRGGGRPFRILVAGPRASLWPNGEATARRFVRAIAEVCRG